MACLINEHKIKEVVGFFHIARSFNQFFLKLNIQLSANMHYKNRLERGRHKYIKKEVLWAIATLNLLN